MKNSVMLVKVELCYYPMHIYCRMILTYIYYHTFTRCVLLDRVVPRSRCRARHCARQVTTSTTTTTHRRPFRTSTALTVRLYEKSIGNVHNRIRRAVQNAVLTSAESSNVRPLDDIPRVRSFLASFELYEIFSAYGRSDKRTREAGKPSTDLRQEPQQDPHC